MMDKDNDEEDNFMDVFNQLKQTAKDLTQPSMDQKVNRQFIRNELTQSIHSNQMLQITGKQQLVQAHPEKPNVVHQNGHQQAANNNVKERTTPAVTEHKDDDDSDIEITEIRYNPSNDKRNDPEQQKNISDQEEDHKVSLTSMIQMKMTNVSHQLNDMNKISEERLTNQEEIQSNQGGEMSDISNGKRNRADEYQDNGPQAEQSHANNDKIRGNFSKGNKHKKLSENNDQTNHSNHETDASLQDKLDQISSKEYKTHKLNQRKLKVEFKNVLNALDPIYQSFQEKREMALELLGTLYYTDKTASNDRNTPYQLITRIGKEAIKQTLTSQNNPFMEVEIARFQRENKAKIDEVFKTARDRCFTQEKIINALQETTGQNFTNETIAKLRKCQEMQKDQ